MSGLVAPVWVCSACGVNNPEAEWDCTNCTKPRTGADRRHVPPRRELPEPDPGRPILRDPSQFLVLPMPRQSMATVKVEGTTLRVRTCPQCRCHTTIPLCPVCGHLAEASKPPPPAEPPGVPQREHSLMRGRRPERGAHLQGALDTMGIDEDDVLDTEAKER